MGITASDVHTGFIYKRSSVYFEKKNKRKKALKYSIYFLMRERERERKRERERAREKFSVSKFTTYCLLLIAHGWKSEM